MTTKIKMIKLNYIVIYKRKDKAKAKQIIIKAKQIMEFRMWSFEKDLNEF